MSVITLDELTIQKLRSFASGVQIRDSAGNVIGTFQPNTVQVYREGEIPELGPVEVKRRIESSERLSSQEVMRRLRSRQ